MVGREVILTPDWTIREEECLLDEHLFFMLTYRRETGRIGLYDDCGPSIGAGA